MPGDTLTLEDAQKMAREVMLEWKQAEEAFLPERQHSLLRYLPLLCNFILSDAMQRVIENAAYERAGALSQESKCPEWMGMSELSDAACKFAAWSSRRLPNR